MHLESTQAKIRNLAELDWKNSFVFAEPGLHTDSKIGLFLPAKKKGNTHGQLQF